MYSYCLSSCGERVNLPVLGAEPQLDIHENSTRIRFSLTGDEVLKQILDNIRAGVSQKSVTLRFHRIQERKFVQKLLHLQRTEK